MSKILTQLIDVVYYYPPHRLGQEGLYYNPVLLGDPDGSPTSGIGPRTSFVPIDSPTGLEAKIEQLQTAVGGLIRDAERSGDSKRCDNTFDDCAAELAKQVLPQEGFCSIVSAGLHPQLHIVGGWPSDIPWELLQERYWVCTQCGRRALAPVIDPAARSQHPCPKGHGTMLLATDEQSLAYCFCLTCKKKVSLEGELFCQYCGNRDKLRLAISRATATYHLSHLQPSSGQPSHVGEDACFLIVADPTGDLCAPEHDPTGICRQHLEELPAIIGRKGFKIHVLAGIQASRRAVLERLKDQKVAGVYYFGHGYYHDERKQSCLVLADGLLSAAEIKTVGPAVRFVFLNACSGAKGSGDWAVEKVCGSVAQTFAQGDRRNVVIAPICPVVNRQAAEAAREFFACATDGSSLGEALISVRRASLDRYEKHGEPDISWASYRYFGDVNRMLPTPPTAMVSVSGAQEQGVCGRVFDDRGMLNRDIFGFDIDAVLLRAAKRRNHQERARITVTDLVAGLVRKGELMRHLLQEEGLVPDDIYDAFAEVVEAGERKPQKELPTDAQWHSMNKEELQENLGILFSSWIVDEREDFTEQASEVLLAANVDAQNLVRSGGDSQISELSLVKAILDAGLWPDKTITSLPGADKIRSQLQNRPHRWPQIDENGAVLLDDVDVGAKAVIHRAHAITRQLGAAQITNRSMLAAFLAEPESYGSRVLLAVGWDPAPFHRLMVTSQERQESLSPSSTLSVSVCSRIVSPMLSVARRSVSQRGEPHVTEADLFRAFWVTADPGFKAALYELWRMEPDRLALVNPECPDSVANRIGVSYPDFHVTKFTPAVWSMLSIAANMAWVQSCPVLRMPHLFAAMIGMSETLTSAYLKQESLDPNAFKVVALATIQPQALPRTGVAQITLSDNVRKVLTYAVQKARSEHDGPVTEKDLLVAFFCDGGSVIGVLLRAAHVRLPSVPHLMNKVATEEQSTLFNIDPGSPSDGQETAPPGIRSELDTLAAELDDHVVGQSAATKMLVQTIRNHPAHRDRPWPILILVGPAGVGKSEAAHITARWLQGESGGLLDCDMSSADCAACFMGDTSQPSGAGNGASLFMQLESKPNSVLMLGRCEKAPREVLRLLEQLVTEGRVVDSSGRTVQAQHAAVIATVTSIGEVSAATRVEDAREELDPDLLRRQISKVLPEGLVACADAILPFKSLTCHDLEVIAKRRTGWLIRPYLLRHKLIVEVKNDVWPWLAGKCATEGTGARAMEGLLVRHLISPLRDRLANSEISDGGKVLFSLAEGGITLAAG